jgi:tetratricopeptide (TPR) repeat protein
MISRIDLGAEQKLASQVKFASAADPEVLHLSRRGEHKILVTAQEKLMEGNLVEAEKLAQQAIEAKTEDQGRALFILAQVATAHQDLDGARYYFQKALGVAQEPKVVAWSHIYLGRIFDLQDDRPGAVAHYQAALSSAASLPDVRAAAQRGIDKPYQPHSQSQ